MAGNSDSEILLPSAAFTIRKYLGALGVDLLRRLAGFQVESAEIVGRGERQVHCSPRVRVSSFLLRTASAFGVDLGQQLLHLPGDLSAELLAILVATSAELGQGCRVGRVAG